MNGNGSPHRPVEVIDAPFREVADAPKAPRARGKRLWPALLLFLLTVLSTLAVGSEFAVSYANNVPPFSSSDDPFTPVFQAFAHPHLLLLGLPFSFTLIAILLAHEMGHYLACRYYRIDASYPYFMPGPPYFGTFGAFILIRSRFTSRRALFDVGIAGPIAGFLVAVPAMAWAVATSKVLPAAQANASVVFGVPPLMHLFVALFHPNVDPNWLLLHPVGRAAWMGLLATALNLFPAWQLDGGHIVFAVSSRRHQRISIAVSLVLLGMGIYGWHPWAVWGIALLVLSLRFRHPPLLDQWEPLDASRKLLALAALAIFLLSFTLWPATNP